VTDALALAGLRILVVDDDADSLETVASLLEINGAEVRTAANALEAQEVLHHFRADLIISDLAMPAGDGLELIMAIRRLPPEEGGETPAIAFTATSDEFLRARALAFGYQEYLLKPIDPARLLGTVTSLIRGKGG
jgi:CheY-like chemotaxis protein